jgi:hypothetical protein
LASLNGKIGSDSPKLAMLGVLGKNGEIPTPTQCQSLQFQPNMLIIESSNSYKDQTAFGESTPIKQYTGATTRSLSTQFFFDTSGTNEDVQNKTDCVMVMLSREEGSIAPPVCVFIYGTFMFVGVVESATQKFLMFNREGIPVRATIDVRLSEYKSVKDESRKARQKNEVKVVMKTNDEELCHIALTTCGDTNQWREIAIENNINNPRLIPAGMQINISVNS